MTAAPTPSTARLGAALLVGGAIGTLGGLIGLGGAEFRLPLLISVFAFVALQAVIVNKAISLVVVASALAFRQRVIPADALLAHWPIAVNLLAGSLAGAWLGADLATRLRAATLYRVIAVLLLAIAAVLALGHDPSVPASPPVHGMTLIVLGIVAGVLIGGIASLLGVAGGEFLIPTLVLLFGLDIKLAGSMSLAISLPTMLVGFARYSRDRSFDVLRDNKAFVLVMVLGSILGTMLGAQLLALVSAKVIAPFLAALLVVSAIKMWGHARRP
jgi:uncharacterized membrane protein YfcA